MGSILGGLLGSLGGSIAWIFIGVVRIPPFESRAPTSTVTQVLVADLAIQWISPVFRSIDNPSGIALRGEGAWRK